MGVWKEETTGLVTLPGGRRVRGRALRDGPPAGAGLPESGLYLTAKPHPEER